MRLTLILLLFTLLAKGQNCSFIITKTFDKFDSTSNFHSPYLNSIIFYKTIKGNDTVYSFKLKSYGSTCVVDGKGVIIILSDGSRIVRPTEKINVDVNSSGQGFTYSAYVYPSKNEISQLLNSSITDYRLYIFDTNVSPRGGKVYQRIINCLINSR